MASRSRRDRDPEGSSGRRDGGQDDGPGASRGPDGWPGPSGWPTPGADDPSVVDLGPETGHWAPEDDLDSDGTATWDGPMVWQDDEQGVAWEQDGGAQEGLGTWEQDRPPTTYSTWGAGRSRSGPYGYESGYPTAYMPSREEAVGAYTDYGGARPEPEWTGDDGGGGHRRRPRRTNGPWPELVMITAVAVIIAAVILAVTSADRTNLANSQTSSSLAAPSTAPRATNTTGHPSTSAPPSSSSTVPRPSTTAPSAGQKAKNLLVTPGVESSLVRSWLATNPGGANLGPKDVAGTQPGQVYYAEQPGSATYWALVAFKPSATLLEESSTAAGQEKLAELQNSIYAFSWQSGPVWTLLGEVSTGSCPGLVPAPVLKVWGMCGL